MATQYSEIFNQFLISVQDYDLLDMDQENAEKELLRLMKRSIAVCMDTLKRADVNIDLNKCNDELQEFEDDLGFEEIELLVAGMERFWWHSKLQNSENMYNPLNLRDFSLVAPQNLIFRQRENAESAVKRFRHFKREYIQAHVDIETMGGKTR